MRHSHLYPGCIAPTKFAHKTAREMLYTPAKTAAASSSREYSLTFEIGPPSSARPSQPFTIPVIVAVQPVSSPVGSPAQQLVVHASLRNENHSPASAGLTGTLTSSVRSRHGNTAAGYAKFSPLCIRQAGRYRIRMMLGAASDGGVTTKEYVDSGVVHVHSEAEGVQRLRMSVLSGNGGLDLAATN